MSLDPHFEEEYMRKGLLVALVVIAVALTATLASAAGLPNLGPATNGTLPVYRGYYNHHIDTYVITDVSNKAQAASLHVNYSAELATVKGLPLQYFVKGRAAAGQITVFGSQPGEATYNPLWKEVWVTWKPGVRPVLLGQDDQINTLVKAGKLTISDAHIVLNAPILKVGK
jgi:hypothetical protein